MIFKKAQSAIEFIIIVGFLMIGFTLFFLVIQKDRESKVSEIQNAQIKEIGLTLKNEVDLAFESSDGYVREFELPEYTYGDNYTISIIEDVIRVSSIDLRHSVSYSVSPVTGDVKRSGINIIKKDNGEVKLNE